MMLAWRGGVVRVFVHNKNIRLYQHKQPGPSSVWDSIKIVIIINKENVTKYIG